MNIKTKMQMKTYWNYFKYIIIHKWYFFCAAMGWNIPWAAITHDLSQFRPSEFFAYANKFYSGDYAYRYFEVEQAFEKAWKLHIKRNKHHWQHWITPSGKCKPMPIKYVKQMICDWEAMGRTQGDTAEEYYYNRLGITVHPKTKKIIEKLI